MGRAGNRARGVDGVDHAQPQIIVPAQIRFALAGVNPRHEKDAKARRRQRAHERIFGAQIENIKFINARRHQQQRARMDLRGLRRVFDELHRAIFEHDFARRGGERFADLKRLAVGVGDHAPGFDVFCHFAHSARDGFAAGLGGGGEDLRVGGREVGGRKRADILLRQKAQGALVVFVEIDFFDHLPHRLAIDEVRAGKQIEKGIFTPFRGGEAAVGAGFGILAVAFAVAACEQLPLFLLRFLGDAHPQSGVGGACLHESLPSVDKPPSAAAADAASELLEVGEREGKHLSEKIRTPLYKKLCAAQKAVCDGAFFGYFCARRLCPIWIPAFAGKGLNKPTFPAKAGIQISPFPRKRARSLVPAPRAQSHF